MLELEDIQSLFQLFDVDGRQRIRLSDVYVAIESVVNNADVIQPYIPKSSAVNLSRWVEYEEFKEIVCDVLAAVELDVNSLKNTEGEKDVVVISDTESVDLNPNKGKSPILINSASPQLEHIHYENINMINNDNDDNDILNDDDDDDDEIKQLQLAIKLSKENDEINPQLSSSSSMNSMISSNDYTNSENESNADDYIPRVRRRLKQSISETVNSLNDSSLEDLSSNIENESVKSDDIDINDLITSEVKHMFSLLDKNNRGFIVLDDIGKINQDLLKENLISPTDLSEMFLLADKNRDGKIDITEFVHILKNKYVKII